MLVFILILILSLSALFFFLGYRLWAKGQITIIHDYHYTRMKESDKKAYTKVMGVALWIMGLGIGAGGIFFGLRPPQCRLDSADCGNHRGYGCDGLCPDEVQPRHFLIERGCNGNNTRIHSVRL
ncbi:hypothetical protein [Eubacterium aggregans]|uniref:hypothetical protein n=1 Tax=Eubacterium aggregans TaxID=81409 RepID=UPI003F39EC8A